MTVHCPDAIYRFQQKVFEWWQEYRRDLPWRDSPTPYHVLISEVMLQQTQVSRVIPKYQEFLREFPDIESLASASTKHLLQVWSGLGYNRRALWLRDAAREIARKDKFPERVEELRELKGIGPYTSRSILIFAFNRDLAAVDTNIRRVLIAAGFATEEMSKQEVQEIADQLVPEGKSRDWHNALMDYGSQVLTSNKTGISPRTSQSRFSGSSREIRGLVIQLITKSDKTTIKRIREILDERGLDTSELEEIICGLVDEGFLKHSGPGTISIAS